MSRSADDGRALAALVAERRVLVCCGSGGAGKTTVAAALGLRGAEVGRRVVVVTVDPARRLASALGVDHLGNEPQRLGPELIGDGGAVSGELWATMLDAGSTFDELVGRCAGDDAQRERILTNRFYRNISEVLSGTHEYMAMEKLNELAGEGGFDLVVVDTPPSRHALDFVEAPARLGRFLDHPLYRALTVPNRGVLRPANLAAQTFVRSAARSVGVGVVDDAVAFFQAFAGMEEGFRTRARRVDELLRSADTGFVLVAAPRGDSLGEAEFLAEGLRRSGVGVDALVVNRMLPDFGDGGLDVGAVVERADALGGTALGDLHRNLAELVLEASRQERDVLPVIEAAGSVPVVRVPLLHADVHDVDGLRAVRTWLIGDAAEP